ncbi:MAG: helix-turn-helix domain-containing protein, partial [bacterium]
VRVIGATNTDLRKAIQRSEFRDDLFYRLNVFPIHIPALRERQNDIAMLANFILAKVVTKMNLGEKVFSANSQRAMEDYSWPGNVRELENTIERAVILAEENVVDMEPFLTDLKQADLARPADSAAPAESFSPPVREGAELKEAVRELEVKMITAALDNTRGNQLKAAKKLGISREGLRKKMMRYDLFRDGGAS